MALRRLSAVLACLLLPCATAAQGPSPLPSPRSRGEGIHSRQLPPKDLAPRGSDPVYGPKAEAGLVLTQSELDALYDGAPLRRAGPAMAIRPEDWEPRVEVLNGDLRRAAVTYRPRGLTLEAGNLGLDARNGLLTKSPYLLLRQDFDCGVENWVDCRLQLGAAMAQLRSRYFSVPIAPDSGADALAQGLAEAALGSETDPEQAAPLLSAASTEDPYRTGRIFLGSVLGQVGRAYGLYGPVDVGWTLSGLMRVTHLFPNAAADATAGTRLRLAGGRSVAAYGGATHNASLGDNALLQGGFAAQRPGYGYYGETAPHAALEFRGPLPFEDQIRALVTASRQWNVHTQAAEIRAVLATDVGGKPTELGGTWRHETGPEIEFERTRAYAGLARQVRPTAVVSLGWQQDEFRYGNAQVKNSGVRLGLKIDLDPPSGGSVSVAHRFDPRDTASSPYGSSDLARVARELNRAVGQVLGVAEAAQAALLQRLPSSAGDPARNPERMEALAAAIRAIPPSTRELYRQTLLAFTADPAERAFIDGLFDGDDLGRAATDLQDGARVLRLIQDETVIERFASRALRRGLADALDRIEIQVPLVDQSFQWSPAVFLAALHTLEARPSPVLPLTAADEDRVLEPWIWRQLASSLRLPEAATPEQVTAELIRGAPPALRNALLAGGGKTTQAFAEALASLMRRELNRILLDLIVAAEQLEPLSVDGGRKAGQLGDAMLSDSFGKLDARRARSRVFQAARARIPQ